MRGQQVSKIFTDIARAEFIDTSNARIIVSMRDERSNRVAKGPLSSGEFRSDPAHPRKHEQRSPAQNSGLHRRRLFRQLNH